MIIHCFERDIDVPDSMIEEYTRDLRVLRTENLVDEAYELKYILFQTLELLALETELLEEPAYFRQLVKALAMKEALAKIKMLHDA